MQVKADIPREKIEKVLQAEHRAYTSCQLELSQAVKADGETTLIPFRPDPGVVSEHIPEFKTRLKKSRMLHCRVETAGNVGRTISIKYKFTSLEDELGLPADTDIANLQCKIFTSTQEQKPNLVNGYSNMYDQN